MKLEFLAEVQLSPLLVKNRPQAKRQFVIPTHGIAPYGVSSTSSIAKESRFHCACSWRRYFAPNGENRKTIAAPSSIHSRQTALSICARSKRNGSDFLWLLSWCWRHHKERCHALVLQIAASPAVDFSQEAG